VTIQQQSESFPETARAISTGGIIAFRTDTFYGLGADPFNVAAIKKIKQLKGREERKPILLIISDPEEVKRFISDPSSVFKLLAEKFWPGPLTLIGKARSEVPQEITATTGTVGLRLPNDLHLRELVRACGGALTATSANKTDESPSRRASDVANYFPSGIDVILDGGMVRTEAPSTVVDATGVEPKLIREGIIEWAAIKSAIDRHE
jgi:L-threonylcarbamoyladenylate synthase